MTILRELLALNQDGAHWLFEIEGGIIGAVLGVLWHRAWQKKHDRKHHGTDRATGRLSERHPSEQSFPKRPAGTLPLTNYIAQALFAAEEGMGSAMPTWPSGERIISWPGALFLTSRVNDEVTTDELDAFAAMSAATSRRWRDGQYALDMASITFDGRVGTFARSGADTWLLVSVKVPT